MSEVSSKSRFSLLTRETQAEVSSLRSLATSLVDCCYYKDIVEDTEIQCDVSAVGTHGIEPLYGKKDGVMVLHIPEERNSIAMNMLRETIIIIGSYVHKVLDKLVVSIEDQVMLVFNEHADKQRRVDGDAAIVRKHRWGDDDSIASPTAASPSSLQNGLLRSLELNCATKLRRKIPDVNPLSAHLFLTLDSLVSSLNTERGSIHLYDDANFLRCVAQHPPSRENSDIPAASTCLQSTVYATGVAVNTSLSCGVDSEFSRKDPNTHKKHKQVLAFPIPSRTGGKHASVGVVTLYNRKSTTGQLCPFRHRDEVLVYDAVCLIGCLLYKYPVSLCLQYVSTASAIAKLSTSPLQPKVSGNVSDLLATVCNQDSEELLILRSPKESIVARDLAGNQKSTFFCETELKECVTYIHSLEEMWRNSLDENSALQGDVTYWKKKKEEKDLQLIAMEVSAKDISKQYIKVKNDLQRVKVQLASPLPELPLPPHSDISVLPMSSKKMGRRKSEVPCLVPIAPARRKSETPRTAIKIKPSKTSRGSVGNQKPSQLLSVI